jgi:pSer/pThr/pTyr-binding forkhead associated (FHA) protein
MCQRQYREGTLFCSECGTYLATGGPLRTEFLERRELSAAQAEQWVEDAAGEERSIGKHTTVRITIQASGRQLFLPATSEILVGRLDAARQIFPELDLMPDGGLEAGVSRQHAKIRHQGGRFFVEDLGSTNGTFVNEQRLPPRLPHPLQAGDKLRLGRLEMTVEFDDFS